MVIVGLKGEIYRLDWDREAKKTGYSGTESLKGQAKWTGYVGTERLDGLVIEGK